MSAAISPAVERAERMLRRSSMEALVTSHGWCEHIIISSNIHLPGGSEPETTSASPRAQAQSDDHADVPSDNHNHN